MQVVSIEAIDIPHDGPSGGYEAILGLSGCELLLDKKKKHKPVHVF